MCEEILRMIEAVSPDDTAKLDEIDARVWCLTHGQEYVGRNVSGEECFRNNYNGMTPMKARKAKKYTRSRDVLKVLRDFNCIMLTDFFYGEGQKYCFSVSCFNLDDENEFTGTAATEELAELSAIIQAIAFERQADGR